MATKPKKRLSTLKRTRQSTKRNLRNKSANSKVKTYIKKLLEAVETKDSAVVEPALRRAVKEISSAASKGVLHKNTASRYVSRLTKKAVKATKPSAA